MKPIDWLKTAWTGHEAEFVSEPGKYGEIPGSELAVHTQMYGKQCTRYALFYHREHSHLTWAHVQTADGHVLDGLPCEVLPWEIRDSIPQTKRDLLVAQGKIISLPTAREHYANPDQARSRRRA